MFMPKFLCFFKLGTRKSYNAKPYMFNVEILYKIAYSDIYFLFSYPGLVARIVVIKQIYLLKKLNLYRRRLDIKGK